MKTIVIASTNPVKVASAKNGFNKMFPSEEFCVLPVQARSNVSIQPFTSDETLIGACNRAANAKTLIPDADFWVGIEGGVEEHGQEMAAFAWVVIQSSDQIGKGRTGSFYLPPQISNLVRAGKELGEADDIVFNRSNSKQENGAIGLLTGDLIDRTQLYEMAVLFALLPFRNPELYPIS
jgi:inosine/xanthosine triphosphatase